MSVRKAAKKFFFSGRPTKERGAGPLRKTNFFLAQKNPVFILLCMPWFDLVHINDEATESLSKSNFDPNTAKEYGPHQIIRCTLTGNSNKI